MIRSIVYGFLAAMMTALPAGAAESCDQALKDTAAAFKASAIGPKSTAEADALIKKATELCKGDNKAEGIELLRVARTMIGE